METKKTKAAFRGSPIELVSVLYLLLQSGKRHLAVLVLKNTTWKDPFLANLEKDLDAVTKKYIGVDTAANLRQATQALLAIIKLVLPDLSILNEQIKVNIMNPVNREEYLNTLGFKKYYADASGKSQFALINLLFAFSQNITPAIEADLLANGVAAATISNLKSYTATLQAANVKQENFKLIRPADTLEAVTAYNDIYQKVIDFAKVARKIMANSDQPQAVNEFSYSKVLSVVKAEAKGAPAPDPAPAPGTKPPVIKPTTDLSGGGH